MTTGNKTFKLEDSVKWTSQALGTHKTKFGIVAQVVPAGSRPDIVKFPKLSINSGMRRKHESYVVAVDCGKKPGSSTRYYWPRVSALSKA